MKKSTAAITGFLVAPLISSLLAALLTRTTRSGIPDPIVVLGLIPILYSASICVVAVLGLPSFLILNRFRLVSLFSSLVTGLLIGVLVAMVVTLPNSVTFHDASVMGFVGALSAFSFWQIWKHGRDSADTKPSR